MLTQGGCVTNGATPSSLFNFNRIMTALPSISLPDKTDFIHQKTLSQTLGNVFLKYSETLHTFVYIFLVTLCFHTDIINVSMGHYFHIQLISDSGISKFFFLNLHAGNTLPSVTCMIQEFQYYTISPCLFNESMSIPLVYVYTMI